jgi:alkanesulfonate monooxygenase SsuD/methylene tetrahydromethanopterin reductase-like flavin-dependent oxidoreductase (luciferase family)
MSGPGPGDLKFGCQVVAYGDVERTIADAARVEDAGFDTITVPDHLFHPTGSEEFLTEPPWECFSVLGAIAQHTDDATVMPGVTDSVRRHPTELAHVGVTIDQMTGGRFGMGIGAGEAFNFTPIEDIDWSDPFGRFSEAFKVIDGLWHSTAEAPFDFDGEHYQLNGAHMGLEPVQEPRPPMWVGGYGRSMRGFTGALADGWFPWIHAPEPYETDLQRVLDVAADRGRDTAEIDRAVMIPTTVSEDGDAARAAAIERNKTSLALRPPLLEALGYPEIADETPIMFEMAFDEQQEQRLLAAADRIPDEAVDEVTVSGTPDEAIADIERWVDAGLDNLVVIPVGDFEETIRHYEETIIPYFDGK